MAVTIRRWHNVLIWFGWIIAAIFAAGILFAAALAIIDLLVLLWP